NAPNWRVLDGEQKRLWNTKLSQYLPQYMLPHEFIELNGLPKTTNGKVDVRKLATHPINFVPADVDDVCATDLEQELISIWKLYLQEEVNITVSSMFFEVGGNSFLAMPMLANINKRYELGLGIRDIYLHSTVRTMAALVERCILISALSSMKPDIEI